MSVVIVCFLAVFAGQKNADVPPLPSELLTAKTIYVVNAGVHSRNYDNSVKELKKWGRWTIVANATESDVTMTLSPQPTRMVNILGRNYPNNSNFMSITSTKTDTVLYGDIFTAHIAGPLKKLTKRLAGES